MKKKFVICRDIDGKTQKVKVSELSFRPSVYGVLIKDNKVLLSPQFGDGYDFPGGGVDIGETLHEALLREVFEETGLKVKALEALDVYDDFFTRFKTAKHYQTILIYYLCEYVSGEISTDFFDKHEKEYAQEAVWMPLSEIDNIKFYNPIDSPKLIRKALARFTAEA